MEIKKENDKDVVKKAIFKGVLQELSSNPIRVGKKKLSYLWQPHNYRMYFNFDKTKFKPPLYKTPTKKSRVQFVYSLKNYGSEHHFDNFYGCRIVVKKNMVEVINKWHEKQWRLITGDNINDLRGCIDIGVKKMDAQGIEALKRFISRFGGNSDYKLIKKRAEFGIHGDDYLDKIPEDMIIHDTYFKKVYPNKVEFYDPIGVKNYISNRVIENVAPEIATEISELKNTLVPVINDLALNMKTHISVLKGIDSSFKRFNRLLLERQKKLNEY